MSTMIQMPIDLPQLTQFQRLSEECGGSVKTALHVWFMLWQKLLYLKLEGKASGRMQLRDMTNLIKILKDSDDDWGNYDDLAKGLISANLVSQENVAGQVEYFCQRFAQDHAKAMDVSERGRQGAWAKSFKHRMEAIDAEVVKQGLLLSPDLFKDAAGKPLAGEESRNVIWLVKALDFALGVKDRPLASFTESLVQNGVECVRHIPMDELAAGVKMIATKRTHPVLVGMMTERILPDFKALVAKLK